MTKSKPNRDKATAPKLGLGWCKNCDSAEVGHGSKCPVCGVRDGKRRRKK